MTFVSHRKREGWSNSGLCSGAVALLVGAWIAVWSTLLLYGQERISSLAETVLGDLLYIGLLWMLAQFRKWDHEKNWLWTCCCANLSETEEGEALLANNAAECYGERGNGFRISEESFSAAFSKQPKKTLTVLLAGGCLGGLCWWRGKTNAVGGNIGTGMVGLVLTLLFDCILHGIYSRVERGFPPPPREPGPPVRLVGVPRQRTDVACLSTGGTMVHDDHSQFLFSLHVTFDSGQRNWMRGYINTMATHTLFPGRMFCEEAERARPCPYGGSPTRVGFVDAPCDEKPAAAPAPLPVFTGFTEKQPLVRAEVRLRRRDWFVGAPNPLVQVHRHALADGATSDGVIDIYSPVSGAAVAQSLDVVGGAVAGGCRIRPLAAPVPCPFWGQDVLQHKCILLIRGRAVEADPAGPALPVLRWLRSKYPAQFRLLQELVQEA